MPNPASLGPPPLPPFRLGGDARREGVRALLRRAMARLEALDLPEPERARIELVLAEVLNNVALHAYGDRPGPCPIRLTCRPGIGNLAIGVCDSGHPMPDGRLPAGRPQQVSLPLADLPEGGFGWFLIRGLAEDLQYERRSGRNHLQFRLPLGRPG